MRSDPFAEEIARQLAVHVGAVSEQQEALAAHGSLYSEASCRINRGLAELEVAAKLLRARAGAAP